MATQQRVADHLFISLKTFRQLIDRGVLPKAERGRYDPDRYREAYIRHLRAVASGHKSEDGGLDLTAERARLAKEQADGQALKNARERGELIPASDCERFYAALVAAARAAIRAIPAKAKGRMPSLKKRDVLVLRDLTDDALDELARGDGVLPPTE